MISAILILVTISQTQESKVIQKNESIREIRIMVKKEAWILKTGKVHSWDL